jgi:hypothetical protein
MTSQENTKFAAGVFSPFNNVQSAFAANYQRNIDCINQINEMAERGIMQ